MAVFIFGSFFFVVAFVLHLIVWRVYLPKRQTKTLLLLFFGVFSCGIYLIYQYPSKFSLFSLSSPLDWVEYFQIGLYLVSLTLGYMITYSAIEADSPSLIILLLIHETGETGLTAGQLKHKIDDQVLIEPRVKDLLKDKMVVENRGKYHLKLKGILLARLFIFYRNLMGAGKGG